ncbi:MAG: V-type ATP synthase subunit A [Rectinemataceae bacterium]
MGGRIVRISGPVIVAEGLDGAGLYDVVQVGEAGLIGEVIRLEGRKATIQIYEENTLMRTGEPVVCRGVPLSAKLGPGLLGSIYDGIQRPLPALRKVSGPMLAPGLSGDPLDITRLWHFVPSLKPGDPTAPGHEYGTVRETTSVLHRLLIPPKAVPGVVDWIVPEGEYRVDDIVLRCADGSEHSLAQEWPVRTPRPVRARLSPGEPLITGLRVVDLLFPLAKGGCAAIPGGFGTGKTMTQHAIAKWCDADIIVYVGCGERGNEMTEVLQEFPGLIDPRTGRSLMERTILIANTSNMPVAAREVSIYTGIALAEYYRDMGLHVAVMADSTSRWAEALRELSGRLEEMPAEEGFPAYLPARLAEFYERGGLVETMDGKSGSVSIIGAVSPPGGDFSEPVTQHTRRFIRCFWALDRDLANARHYPAISWNDSYSEYADELSDYWGKVDPTWQSLRKGAMDLLKRERRLAEIVRLIGPDALPDEQRLVLISAEMIKNGFLQQSSFDPVDMYCEPARQALILRCILEFHRLAEAAVKAGAPLPRIIASPLRERIVRLKSLMPNGDFSLGQTLLRDMTSEFEELTRRYRGEAAR